MSRRGRSQKRERAARERKGVPAAHDARRDSEAQASSERGTPSFGDLLGDDPDLEPLESSTHVSPKPRPGRRRFERNEDMGRPSRGAAIGTDMDGEANFGVSAGTMRDLRAGRIRPDARIDLHRLDRSRAQHALRKAIGLARAHASECVLVIHGRGRRSLGGEPVLKNALAGWLATPPLRDGVRAFAAARPADGGEGASYILLHPRSPRRGGVVR